MLKKLLIVFLYCYIIPVQALAEKTILVLGDSISAGYGISIKQGWVSLLQEHLNYQGYSYHVVNASISGDTTRSASVRVKNLLKTIKPDIAVIELGGNDGLRGLALEEMSQNLNNIIKSFKADNVRILLIPMQLPPNYGPIYNERFQAVYEKLAAQHNVKISRFILEKIGKNPQLMQNDGIHPKAEAQEMMLKNIWPSLESILTELIDSP